MVPQGSNINITKENIMDLQELDQKWTAKEFFKLAGLPKEQAILWYRKCCKNEVFHNSVKRYNFQVSFTEW